MEKILPLFLIATISTFLVDRAQSRHIEFVNECAHPIWLHQRPSLFQRVLPGGEIFRLEQGARHSYELPIGSGNETWSGSFWPRFLCDESYPGPGKKCEGGNFDEFCSSWGCTPPGLGFIEFSDLNSNTSLIEMNLEDGFNLPFDLTPITSTNTKGQEKELRAPGCKPAHCLVSLEDCPVVEVQGLGDLKVVEKGQTVQCRSPCATATWNNSLTYDNLSSPWRVEPGLSLCCPRDLVTRDQCRSGPILKTKYVEYLRRVCPLGSSYNHDDNRDLMTCPRSADYRVTYCPAGQKGKSSV